MFDLYDIFKKLASNNQCDKGKPPVGAGISGGPKSPKILVLLYFKTRAELTNDQINLLIG